MLRPRAGSAPAFLMATLVALACLLAPRSGPAQTSDATATGISRAFNPAISLNGLFLLGLEDGMPAVQEEGGTEEEHGHAHEHESLSDGFRVQEVELRLSSVIDVYSRADATLAFHEGEVSFEEIYINSTALGRGLGLGVGRFFVPVSRENTTHTHQLPFVQRSLVQEEIFGESYGDVGLQVDWLAPTDFYASLRAAVYDGESETWFDGPESEDFAYHGGLKLLFELGESTTLGLEGGYVGGRNGLGDTSHIASGGVTLKWRPTRRSIYRSFQWNTEFTRADRGADLAEEELEIAGLTNTAQFQFARRWWTAARFDWLDPTGHEESDRVGLQIAFVPSEFQALRAEVSRVNREGENFTEFFLQYNFTIGSHPAHRY